MTLVVELLLEDIITIIPSPTLCNTSRAMTFLTAPESGHFSCVTRSTKKIQIP